MFKKSTEFFRIGTAILTLAVSSSLKAGEIPDPGPLPLTPPIPENVITKTDVAYGREAGQDLLADLYLPQQATGPRAALIFIHGGGWAVSNKRQIWPVYLDFAKQGFVVMSINWTVVRSCRFF